MSSKFMGLVLAFLSSFGFAQEAVVQGGDDLRLRDRSRAVVASTEGAEFSIDAKMVDKLYTASLEQAQIQDQDKAIRLGVGYGQLVPTVFALENRYYRIPIAEQSNNLPYAFLSGQRVFFERSAFAASIFGTIGYSNTQGIYEVYSKSGEMALRDSITYQWVPVGLGLTGELYAANRIRPGLVVGAGMDWISQSGALDGINQSYRLPSYFGGPTLTLFPNTDKTAIGFDGLTVSSVYRSTFGENEMRGWAINIGTRFAM